MAFRMGGGNNRRNDNNRSFDRGGYGNNMNRPDPWGNNSGGNFRQGGGGNMNNDVLSLANSLVNTFMRNQPPSLLDLPNRGGYGNRDNFGRFDDRILRGNRNFGPNRRNGGARNQKLGAIKSGGIRKPNPVDRAKKVLAKNASNSANPNAEDDSADAENKLNVSSKKERKESKYADVPNVMFYCHMCKKHMWDATSFENHVKGRTHLMMKDGVEESYRLRANMIRQEAKIEEQLKSIELERLKRMGKAGKGSTRREYCTMCDLHFYGHLSGHRKTDGHLQLKKFLHPKCGECGQEFATRIDYDNHLLTPVHMKKAHATRANRPEKRKHALHISTEEEELKDLKEEKEEKKTTSNWAKKVGKEAAATVGEGMEMDGDGEKAATENGDGTEKDEGDDGGDAKEDEEEVGDEEMKGENEKHIDEPAPEPEDVILDYKDGDDVPVEIDNKVPKYKSSRQLGWSMLHKLDCFECQLCGRFFDTDTTAEIHTRTLTHHRNFVKFLNEKANDTRIAQKRAAAALEENERKKRRLEAAVLNASENTVNDEDAEKKEGDETYDPSEATGDEDAKDKDDLDETMDDGDEHFEDANASVKDELKDEQMDEPAVATPVAPAPVAAAVAPAPAAAAVAAVAPAPAAKEPEKPVQQATAPVTTVVATPTQTPVVTQSPTPTPAPATPKNTPSNRGRRGGRGGRKF